MHDPCRPAIALLFLALIAAQSGQAAVEGRAAVEEKPCRLLNESLPAAFGQCATLEVPASYAAPDGPKLELFLARIPALSADPEPDPLLLINGGPGGSAVDLYLQTRAAFEPIRRERDILLLDQRGTGRSLAGLDCKLPEDFDLVTASADAIRSTVAACIGEFDHDPRDFTTSVAVRDLETLRATLGLEQWNIYGVSYGTRVAQHYLRHYGERVRTMILDGVVPAELALGPEIASDAQHALDAIFARCSAEPACAKRFPSLPDRFEELRRRFAGASTEVILNDPLTGAPKSMQLDESQLQGVVRLMSYNDATVALLPLILDAAWQGNYLPLAAEAELQIQSVEESIGFAMHNSVVCTEDAPWFPADDDPDSALLYLGSTVVDGLRAICESWPAGVLDPDFKEPVTSDRPVLLLSGGDDPVTPPANAEHVLEAGLSDARHLIAPAQGHGIAAVGCVPRIMHDFVTSADPAALDAGCLADEPPMPFFLNFQGPAP